MISPYRCVDEIIFTAVCDREIHKINAILELQVIGDFIVRIVISVSLLRDGIGCDHDPVLRIGVADCRPAGILTVLRSPPNIHMVPGPVGVLERGRIGGAGRIHFQQAGIEGVCDTDGFFAEAGYDDRV